MHSLYITRMNQKNHLGEIWMQEFFFTDMFCHFTFYWSAESDEDSPKWPWVPQSHVDWSNQYGWESPALEVAGCEWHCALLVMQARNDDDDDDDELVAALVI